MKKFADVVVELPVEGEFTYEVPEALSDEVAVGKRVVVPFGRRSVTGYVVALKKDSAVERIRPVTDVLDDVPIFDKQRLRFLRWLASYYLIAPGEVFSLSHPSSANVRSHRFFRLTERGREALCGPEGGSPGARAGSKAGSAHEVLGAIKDGAALSVLAKRVRCKSLYTALERLKKEGLISEETRLSRAARARTERVASIAPGASLAGAIDEIGRFPLQRKLIERLGEDGPATLAELRKALGSVDGAAKRLAQKGLIVIEERTVERDPFGAVAPRASNHRPTAEQEEAIRAILATLDGGFSPYLLYGVTGSGKTFVYLKVIEEVVRGGRQALVLVPEIALTERVSGYLAARFPGRVALVHSSLSEGERYDQWRRILRGEVDVVIGARSALFAPLARPGVIIVDEEHDPSYKQEEGARYNARDSALMLGKLLGITVVLGSATPSIETFHNSLNGKITPISLKGRVGGGVLPEVEIFNMKGAPWGTVISERLAALMADTLAAGGQTLLFLNRRGFSNFLICRDCGRSISCLNCSVTLTLHKGGGGGRGRLKCHYCDFSLPAPDKCPECSGHNLAEPGVGTEKVVEEVRRLFPKARIARLDRDTARGKGAVKRIIELVEARDVDVLIGTQMVSKGHHFPGISLVGIISGDTALNIPDFRAPERTFQLISQASGRAGREGGGSRVVIQTLDPDNFCFRSAAGHDYEGFFREELKAREDAGYPPFSRLSVVRIEGVSEARVAEAAQTLKRVAAGLGRAKGFEGIAALGPAPCSIARLKGRFRMQMLIKGGDPTRMNAFLRGLKEGFEKGAGRAGAGLIVDVDPTTTI